MSRRFVICHLTFVIRHFSFVIREFNFEVQQVDLSDFAPAGRDVYSPTSRH